MKKVLVLTAKFGDGHNTAALNIRDAVTVLDQEARVEVVDLLQSSYGSLYSLARSTHLKVVQYAPRLWSSIYSLIDQSSILERNLAGLAKAGQELERLIEQTEPDCIVSTYPLYGHVVSRLYQDHQETPFRFLTVITDSISVNSAWFKARSDFYCVANEATADVLRHAGIAGERVRPLGFPVSPVFALEDAPELPYPNQDEPKRVLYIINSGQKKAGKAIDRLLELNDVRLTITVGRDAWLKAKLLERTRSERHRVQVLGWTNQMPALMRSHHLVIGKAGGAAVQECLAACCPMIINQIIPGQEQGNAQLVVDHDIGAVADSARDVPSLVEQAFARNGRQWSMWRENARGLSRPDASLRIAELILEDDSSSSRPSLARRLSHNNGRPMPSPCDPGAPVRMLLCDFHIHTNYSDGQLTLPEVVDFYGELGFDCICITDHLADPNRLIGKMTRLCRFTLGVEQLDEYFEVLARERARAWRKYGMIVMPGLEFNKDGYTRNSSAHLLALDLKYPIDASLEIPELIERIQDQDALAVASHPHIMHSEWGKNTLYFWKHQEEFAPLLDAWEIANRENIFNPVGLKRLPFIANSDFHKPKHIYSWKTLLHCAKDAEAIKESIRRNRNISITLFRGPGQTSLTEAKAPQAVRKDPEPSLTSARSKPSTRQLPALVAGQWVKQV